MTASDSPHYMLFGCPAQVPSSQTWVTGPLEARAAHLTMAITRSVALEVAALALFVSSMACAGEGLSAAAGAPLSLMEDFLVLRERLLASPATAPSRIEQLETRLDGLARSAGLIGTATGPDRSSAALAPTISSLPRSGATTAPATAATVRTEMSTSADLPPLSDADLQARLFLHKGYAFLARKGGQLADRARARAREYLGAFRPRPRVCTYLDSGGLKVIFRGDPARKEISLTFDDGPIEGNNPERGTRAILKVLADTGCHGTFFMCGDTASAYPWLVREVARAGHSVANHTKSHARSVGLPRLSVEGMRDEVGAGKRMIQKALGPFPMPLFRLPYGAGVHTERVNKIVAEYHDFSIYWTIDTRDWQKVGYRRLVDTVLASPYLNGAIVLFHDHGIDVPAAVRTIITTLKPQGYRFVSLDEMLGVDAQTNFLEGFERAAGQMEAGRDQVAYELFLRAAQEAPSATLAREALDFAYLLARLSLDLGRAHQARSLLTETFRNPRPSPSPVPVPPRPRM